MQNGNGTTPAETRSPILPSDPFEITLSRLLDHPDGAHTQPTVADAIDFYGNATTFIVRTVKWAEGTTVFLTHVDGSGRPPIRLVLPPKVMQLILRQQEAVSTMVRRRVGKRLMADRIARGEMRVGFTPEMRAKAAKTRKANAAKRRARKAARA
jgi:hypothetical protein